jgi:IS605 OrfB family transposase
MDQDMLVLVLVRKSFRYRVYPSETQIKRLEQWEHALRSLWNLALEQRLWGLARARDERRYYSAFDQINQLTELRAEFPWLAEVPRNVCAQILVELDKAWQRCFKKLADEPRWKRKGRDIVNFAKSHGTVVVERLQIRNMVRNRHLSRRIGAAGWGRLVTFLGYKTAWAGGQTVEEEAAYSSQTCAVCGHVDAASRSGERFCCTKCGVVAHADVNAAKVLKARYLARTRVNRSGFACGGMPPEGARRSRKRLNVARRSSESSAL